jgi:hypothetical protein
VDAACGGFADLVRIRPEETGCREDAAWLPDFTEPSEQVYRLGFAATNARRSTGERQERVKEMEYAAGLVGPLPDRGLSRNGEGGFLWRIGREGMRWTAPRIAGRAATVRLRSL